MREPEGDGDGDAESEERASRGEDEAFGEELPHDSGSAGAERGAHGELLAARGCPGQQQVGEVHAHDELDEPDGAPQQFERAAKTAADVLAERLEVGLISLAPVGMPAVEV